MMRSEDLRAPAERLRDAVGMSRPLNSLQSSGLVWPRFRRLLLRLGGVRIGRDAVVFSGVLFETDKCVIGDNSFIGHRCFIDGCDWVRIGNDVLIAAGVQLITSTHEIGPSWRRGGRTVTAPVTVGDGCWLGAGCTVLPGVEIGSGCVIGAGALVTKSTEPDGLYVGVPARRVSDFRIECATG
jgi:maltose O-acetyltransferase